MNARRLAATETNIAYRTADYTRWQEMDFVVGIEIHLSNNHNCKGVPAGMYFDICDELKGRYPKEFKFAGWHPHCRCYATSILKSQEEIQADNERILNGERLTNNSVNAVANVPDNFNKWIENNSERIKRAKSLPYFIKDNFKSGKLMRDWLGRKKRTESQINEIKKRWLKRSKTIAKSAISLAKKQGFVGLGVDISAVTSAMSIGDVSRITSELKQLKQSIENKKKQILAKLQATLKEASKFKEIKVETLEKAIVNNDYIKIAKHTETIQLKINALKEQRKIEAKQKKTGKITTKHTNIQRETLDELKKRLGSSLPETLKHIDEAIASYEKSIWYGDIAKKHKEEIETLMRKIFDTHDYGMNVKEEALDKILTSWFKNTFEVGTSGGYIGSTKTTGKIELWHFRLGKSHEMFGLSKDLNKQLSRRAYEKYGSLLDHDILTSLQNQKNVEHYGKVQVRFKKNKVLTTWAPKDTLDDPIQPSLCSDPKSCSFDRLANTPMSSKIDTTNLRGFVDKHCSQYIELQYHGNLTVDCVESLAFPYDILSPSHRNILNTAKKWKEKGVDIYYITSKGTLGKL